MQKKRWLTFTSEPYYRLGIHRRFGAFSGPFDRFLYMDADTLLLQDISPIFKQLDSHDWITYDFQHRDVIHVYNCASEKLLEVFTAEKIDREIFCAGFYAVKRGTFSQAQLDTCLNALQAGEHDIFRRNGTRSNDSQLLDNAIELSYL